ncbi:MAG: sigma-54 dependent transcriptional regulator [Rikenellaceae bacterium]
MYRTEITGQSVAISKVLHIVERLASTSSRVLITGENGTGKEVVARMIHRSGQGRHSQFVAVNCAAIPSELIDSELFGYEKGAFTGAMKQYKGKFEQADGGTIFLDEVGDMSLSAQAKVLRVLQEGKVTRIGGEREIPVNVRVISATNKDLRSEVLEHTFREDLYHRLSVIELCMPSLRERKEDIPELVSYFIRTISHSLDRTPPRITSGALRALIERRWPGNIRQLSNNIERLIVLCENPQEITLSDVRTLCT